MKTAQKYLTTKTSHLLKTQAQNFQRICSSNGKLDIGAGTLSFSACNLERAVIGLAAGDLLAVRD